MIEDDIQDGETCLVTGGTHKGKSGTVEDRNLSKTGQVTITVRQADGVRFKTLARNVRRQGRALSARSPAHDRPVGDAIVADANLGNQS